MGGGEAATTQSQEAEPLERLFRYCGPDARVDRKIIS